MPPLSAFSAAQDAAAVETMEVLQTSCLVSTHPLALNVVTSPESLQGKGREGGLAPFPWGTFLVFHAAWSQPSTVHTPSTSMTIVTE